MATWDRRCAAESGNHIRHRASEADQLIICPPHSDKLRPAGYLSLIAGHNEQPDPPQSGVTAGPDDNAHRPLAATVALCPAYAPAGWWRCLPRRVGERVAAVADHGYQRRRLGQRDRRQHRQPASAARVRAGPADRVAVFGAAGGGRDGRQRIVGEAGIGCGAGDLAGSRRADGPVLRCERQAAGIGGLRLVRRWRCGVRCDAVFDVGVGVLATRAIAS